MIDVFRSLDSPRAARFCELAARSFLGVSILPAASALAAPAKEKTRAERRARRAGKGGTAKNVIYLFMTGAMTHLDTFDLKPGRDVQGETKGINTNVSGMRFGEQLPQLAKQADKLAVVRSLYTETGDHQQGRYLMRTSYKEIASIRHPGLGAWAMRLQGRRNKTLPDNVTIGVEARHPGAGFLDPSLSPIPIGDPAAGLQNTKSPVVPDGQGLRSADEADRQLRQRASRRSSRSGRSTPTTTSIARPRSSCRARTSRPSISRRSPEKVRTDYGDDRFGQGCLLARRLIEHNVRFVEVALDGWDHHVDHLRPAAGEGRRVGSGPFRAADRPAAGKGLLKDTLVVLATEFGRSPKINANAGATIIRASSPACWPAAAFRGGRFFGTSDKDGHSPNDDPVAVADFNATIAWRWACPWTRRSPVPPAAPSKSLTTACR